MHSKIAATLFFLAMPAIAAGQTWRELYDRGEYERAAAILHPVVFEPFFSAHPFSDVEATELLATMYAAGQGVAQDRVIACSLANLALNSAHSRYDVSRDRVLARMERLMAAFCDALSREDRHEAGRMMGCPKYGDTHVYALDAGHSVQVSRRGIRIEHAERHHVEELPTTCFERIALVRHTRVDPPARAHGGIKSRHLIELFSWTPGIADGQRQRVLQWKLAEIVGAKVEWHAGHDIARETGLTWTPLGVPPEVTSVTFEMSATGEIRWQLPAARLADVVRPLPVAIPPEVLPPLQTKGLAQVNERCKPRSLPGQAREFIVAGC